MELTPNESFERCCRLCAEEQEVTIAIFGAEAEALNIQNKLNKYLLIEVDENDKLPKNMCIQCCSKLQTVCDFIDTAHNAQIQLFQQSILLDQFMQETSTTIRKVESQCSNNYHNNVSDDEETSITQMEVSVDPMLVLQNSEEHSSPTSGNCSTRGITYLHGVDGEDVTIKLIKKGDPNDDSDTSTGNESNIKPFPCVKCKRSFLTELALKNHSWSHVNEEKPVKPYKCTLCDLKFQYKCNLISHMKVHKPSGRCHLCGRVFRSQRTLASHMSVHMVSNKAFTCHVCDRSYSTQSNLNTHSITHSNERPFHCHLCKKAFKRNIDLKFHINQHTGAKPYKCPFCDKSFASSGNCYSHRSRMHPGKFVEQKRRTISQFDSAAEAAKVRLSPKNPFTSVKGIYKYQCQICEHSFMKRDNFTYHMYQHTGEKPFQCSFCIEKFVTRKGLLLHHDKEHPGQNRPLALVSKNVLLK